jgi:hypothetical protein
MMPIVIQDLHVSISRLLFFKHIDVYKKGKISETYCRFDDMLQ